jgi:hypothetical protein
MNGALELAGKPFAGPAADKGRSQVAQMFFSCFVWFGVAEVSGALAPDEEKVP